MLKTRKVIYFAVFVMVALLFATVATGTINKWSENGRKEIQQMSEAPYIK